MPQGSTRVSAPLTRMSVEYKNKEYIANDVLGSTPVKNESDLYWVYNSDMRLPETRRANKAQANVITFDASTSSYVVREESLRDLVSDRDMNNADSVLMLKKHTMEYVIDKILMRQEFDSHQLLFTTTTWGGNATLNTATSWVRNTTTSAPIQNMLSATTRIVQQSGKKANKGVMGIGVRDALKENENVHERIKYVERSILTDELLASLFDLDKLHVGSAVYNANKEGQAQSNTSIWGTDCLVGYFKPNPGLKDVTAATMFRIMTYGSPYRVKSYREESVEGDWVEVQSMYAPRAVATSAAYIFKTVTIT